MADFLKAINLAMVAVRWSQILLWGSGQHAYDIPVETVEAFTKSFLAVQILYFTNAVFTKTSLLLLYYRIFGVIKGFRWVLWTAGFLVIAYYIACVITSIAGCSPVNKFWNPSVPGKCINEVEFFRYNGIANMLLDVMVLCLPYPMAWRLQATARQKLILTGMFLLGGFVVVVSILRITSFNFHSFNDATYVSATPSTWSSIEQSVGIICACLPTLRPLLRCWMHGGSKGKNTLFRNSTSSSHPKSVPLVGRSSQGDEESGVVSPVPPVSPLQPAHVRGHSSHELGSFENQSRGSWTPMPPMSPTSPLSQVFESGEQERFMHRPESFA
ncbi:hypothetical protein N7476_011448 [Penicillium atrosanguineum]|uniref:Rhodopsin domain-containing protein n=1 Tax=Penicillium atrosanguineum TaxID=1132637 RepID=A0A9W9PMM0_9EURO|nr:hypothetical protein N7526_010734 [Penicillium atrosanguineum]KAJ5299891.1 hypothetical protein N7476_011448 [Penicillium atrosanguineum]